MSCPGALLLILFKFSVAQGYTFSSNEEIGLKEKASQSYGEPWGPLVWVMEASDTDPDTPPGPSHTEPVEVEPNKAELPGPEAPTDDPNSFSHLTLQAHTHT